METTLNPIVKKYRELKEQYPDAMLLFRVGDFYETYEDDAKAAAQHLGITLTIRSNDRMRLSAFPHHALDTYLPKLVRAGYRIAIVDGEPANTPIERYRKQCPWA